MRELTGWLVIVGSIVVSPHVSAVFPICSKQTLAGKVESIFTPIRYYGPTDRRGPLSKKAKEFKLSKTEVAQIRKSFGFIFCQPDPNQDPFIGGAFLAENNCEIWTVGHGITNDSNEPIDLKFCGFQNFEVPGRRVKIDVASKRNITPGTDGTRARLDRSRLRLKDCIPGAKPLVVDGLGLNPGDEFMSITASNADLPMGTEPTVGPGRVEYADTLNDGTRLLYTSNDQDKGASGGIDVVRLKGQLAVRAMHVQMKAPLSGRKQGDPANGAPFDKTTNFNRDLELSGPVLEVLKAN